MGGNIFMRRFKYILITVCLLLSACQLVKPQLSTIDQENENISNNIELNKTLFPLDNYPQDVQHWLPPTANNYALPVISQSRQQAYFAALLSKYYGMGAQDKSPWNADYITRVLNNKPEKNRDTNIRRTLLPESVSWGENFRVNSKRWKEEIRNNSQVAISHVYQASSRAITVRETRVRALPTEQPAYHDPKKAGEGYPFDYLQMSAIRPATPVYILTASFDKAWLYVISPAVTGWVKSDDIATVNTAFVSHWTSMAMKKLGGFIKQPVAVSQGQQFYFQARPGTVLPFKMHQSGYFSILIPVRKTDGSALMKTVLVPEDAFTAMPWEMTPANIATLMKSMSGQSYGWGNELFYNDCSSELRSLLMPFGILLPRNSAAQIKSAVRLVDLSKESLTDRIAYLEKHGQAFTTLVYLPGHIMLYIGNHQINGQSVPMTYQNIWGLRPKDKDSRSIIGSSVFFPLLATYPERPEMRSLADKKQFKLGFLEVGKDEG